MAVFAFVGYGEDGMPSVALSAGGYWILLRKNYGRASFVLALLGESKAGLAAVAFGSWRIRCWSGLPSRSFVRCRITYRPASPSPRRGSLRFVAHSEDWCPRGDHLKLNTSAQLSRAISDDLVEGYCFRTCDKVNRRAMK